MNAARQRGVALVLALWAVALMTVLAVAFAFDARVETRAGAASVDRLQADALADAGIRRGIYAMLPRDPLQRWQPDGRVYTLALPDGTAEIRVFSELGKIDVNAAPPVVLTALLRVVSESLDDPGLPAPEALADAIQDWRDSDDRARAAGAEAADYRAAGLALAPANRRFVVVEELRQVLGMTPALYRALAPHVTVFTRAAQVDAMAATRAVLLSLPGLDPAEVDAFIEAREETRSAPPDAANRFGRTRLDLLANARRFLVRSPGAVYTIAAVGRSPGGGLSRREAVVRVTGNQRQPYLVFSWTRPGVPS